MNLAHGPASLALALLLGGTPEAREEPSECPFTVHLKSRTFVPPATGAVALESILARCGGERAHLLLQLEDMPDAATKRSFRRAGIRLLEYIPRRTWIASVSGDLAKSHPVLASIRWVGTLLPTDKMARQILENEAISRGDEIEISIRGFRDARPDRLRREIERIGGTVLTASPSFNVVTASVPGREIASLARADIVQWMAPIGGRGRGECDRIRKYYSVNALQDLGIKGKGVKVGVFDEGHVSKAHLDFQFPPRLTQGDTDAYSPHFHPTMTAGIIAGDGSQSSEVPDDPTDPSSKKRKQYTGMAPEAEIYSYFIAGANTNANVADIEKDLSKAIKTDGIDIANFSWGVEGCEEQGFDYGEYTDFCRYLDSVVRGAEGSPLTIVFSAGNERDGFGASNAKSCIDETKPPYANYGTLNQPKPAKNIITVGAVDSFYGLMTSYSSWGPTADGRLKPDIVGPGHHRGTRLQGGVTARSQEAMFLAPYPSQSQYGYFGMTSCAAAVASGSLALLIGDYRTEFPDRKDPLPSTWKALVIQTARDAYDPSSTGLTVGPDFASGYGRLDVKAALDLMRSGSFLEGEVKHGEILHFHFMVPGETTSTRVTLVWDDVEASVSASTSLVNDLDLIVRDPDGNRYFPWTLDPDNPSDPAVRKYEDHTNNVEQVFVDKAHGGGYYLPPGIWEIAVRGTNVPQGPQSFSLVALQVEPASLAGRWTVERKAVDLVGLGRCNDVWGSSANDVYVVGLPAATMLHYDGSTWSKIAVGVPKMRGAELYGIWGSAQNDIFAVGYSWREGESVVLHFDGTKWSRTNPRWTGTKLWDVWGSSAGDVYAVGTYSHQGLGILVHYDGTVWDHSFPSGKLYNGGFNAVWSSAADDVYVVGGTGSLLHYDGKKWSIHIATVTTEDLFGVCGVSGHIYAVGANGTLVHSYEGAETLLETQIDDHFRAIWGSPALGIFSVGGYLIPHPDSPYEWSGDPCYFYSYYDVYHRDLGGQIATMRSENELFAHWEDDDCWMVTTDFGYVHPPLNGIWGSCSGAGTGAGCPGVVFAVGWSGFVMRYKPAPSAEVDLGDLDIERGLRNTQRGTGTDGGNEAQSCGPAGEERNGRKNWGTASPDGTADFNFYFNVLNSAVKSAARVRIEALVYDDVALAGTKVKLEYTNIKAADSNDVSNVFALHPLVHELEGTDAWRTLAWELEDAGFRTLMKGTSDFRMVIEGGRLCVDRVAVRALSSKVRFSVEVDLGDVDQEKGMSNTHRSSGTDGGNEPATCGPPGDQRDARKNWLSDDPSDSVEDPYFYFAVNDPQVKKTRHLFITAVVYDDPALAGTEVRLQYTNSAAPDIGDLPNVYAEHPRVHILEGKDAWRTIGWEIHDAGFRSMMFHSADFRLKVRARLCVDRVRVTAIGNPVTTLSAQIDFSPTLAYVGGTVKTHLLMSNLEPVDGFSAGFSFDPAALQLEAVTLEGTVAETAEYFEPYVDDEEGWCTTGVIMSMSGEDRSIPPGANQPIAGYVFSVGCTPSEGLALRFEDGFTPGVVPVLNEIVVGGQRVAPEFRDGLIGVFDFDVGEATATDVSEEGASEVRIRLCWNALPGAGEIDRVAIRRYGEPIADLAEGLSCYEDAFPPDVLQDPGEGDLSPVTYEIEFEGRCGRTAVRSLEVRVPREVSEPFQRGDADADGRLSIGDGIFVLNYIFVGGSAPPCPDAADANDDGHLDIGDAIKILFTIFAEGGPMPDPYLECGPDPTPDAFGRCTYVHCP